MRIKVPKDGVVGGTPTPKNDKVASVINRQALGLSQALRPDPKRWAGCA